VQRHPGPTTNAEVEQAAAEGPVEGAAPTTTEATTQPGTGTGTTGTTGAGLTGDARKKAIQDTLNASATGMWAMKILDKWKIPVDWEYTGVGSFHQGGKIYLNKSLGVGAAAMTMMHEAQHADTFKSGKQADRTKLGRAEYVKQSIADEAEAVVRQVEGLAVTTGLGVDMTGNSVGQGLKDRYLKAFYAKRDELRKTNPEMTTAQINEICRKTTRDGEVTNWFYDGTFTVSVEETPTSYPDFYGKQWDDVNKPPAKK
jgi:hypothetical protein